MEKVTLYSVVITLSINLLLLFTMSDNSDFELDISVNSNNYDYKSEIVIDADALDVEWLQQPQLFIKYAEATVKAEMRYDKAKEYLDFIRAELDTEIRSNPLLYTQSDKKPTEGRISSLILTNPKYKNALDRYNTTKKQFKILSVALKAFEQRKSALENLVRLHGQSYFSSPTLPVDSNISENTLSFRESAVRKKVQEKIKKKLNQSNEE